jgi:hypothetical protein
VIFVGIDWSETHHDVCVIDVEGRVLAKVRVPEGVEGLAKLHELLSAHAEEAAEVVVGIELDRGLLVGALVAAGYSVHAINPLSVDRYRDRHRTSGAKSDPGDARVLADLVRTDLHLHRKVAGDSELAEAVARRGLRMLGGDRSRAVALLEVLVASALREEDLAAADACQQRRQNHFGGGTVVGHQRADLAPLAASTDDAPAGESAIAHKRAPDMMRRVDPGAQEGRARSRKHGCVICLHSRQRDFAQRDDIGLWRFGRRDEAAVTDVGISELEAGFPVVLLLRHHAVEPDHA